MEYEKIKEIINDYVKEEKFSCVISGISGDVKNIIDRLEDENFNCVSVNNKLYVSWGFDKINL